MGTATGLAVFSFAFSIPFMLYAERVVGTLELGLVYSLSGALLAALGYGLRLLGAQKRDPFIRLAGAACFFACSTLPVAWFAFGGMIASYFAITWT
jgi:hypothetical protein